MGAPYLHQDQPDVPAEQDRFEEPAPTVRVVAMFDGDGERWWFDRLADVGDHDHDPTALTFVVELPAADWDRWRSAIETLDQLTESFVEIAGLDPDDGTLLACAQFAPEPDPPTALHYPEEVAAHLRRFRRCTTCGKYESDHR